MSIHLRINKKRVFVNDLTPVRTCLKILINKLLIEIIFVETPATIPQSDIIFQLNNLLHVTRIFICVSAA
jgi:hypothetical protein